MPPTVSSRVGDDRSAARFGSWVVVALAVLAYLPGLWNDFVWDDVPHIADNPRLESIGAAAGYLTEPVGPYYRPVVLRWRGSP